MVLESDSPQDDSLLGFRILRLSKPELYLRADQVKLDLGADMLEGVSSTLFPDERKQLVTEEAFAKRVEGLHASDSFGMDGCIKLPKNMGQVYLGETICCFVSLSNSSSQVVSCVGMKAEVQSKRSRVVVFDDISTGMPVMPPGKTRGFIFRYDVKEPGAHTIICSSQFTAQEGDRMNSVQYFRFSASTPLSIRPKVRMVGGAMYLEACLENGMTKSLLLDYVNFEPTTVYQAEPIEVETSAMPAGPLTKYINSLQIIQPNKGTRHFVFKLTRIDKDACPGKNLKVLGKMEIRWKGSLGETGRIQTQQIVAGAATGLNTERDIYGEVSLPDADVIMYQPFDVNLRLWNDSTQAVGPLSLVIRPGSGVDNWDMPVLLHGVQSISVDTLPPKTHCDLQLKMVATAPGVHTIEGLTAVHETDGFEYGTVSPHQIFVKDPN